MSNSSRDPIIKLFELNASGNRLLPPHRIYGFYLIKVFPTRDNIACICEPHVLKTVENMYGILSTCSEGIRGWLGSVRS